MMLVLWHQRPIHIHFTTFYNKIFKIHAREKCRNNNDDENNNKKNEENILWKFEQAKIVTVLFVFALKMKMMVFGVCMCVK